MPSGTIPSCSRTVLMMWTDCRVAMLTRGWKWGVTLNDDLSDGNESNLYMQPSYILPSLRGWPLNGHIRRDDRVDFTLSYDHSLITDFCDDYSWK